MWGESRERWECELEDGCDWSENHFLTIFTLQRLIADGWMRKKLVILKFKLMILFRAAWELNLLENPEHRDIFPFELFAAPSTLASLIHWFQLLLSFSCSYLGFNSPDFYTIFFALFYWRLILNLVFILHFFNCFFELNWIELSWVESLVVSVSYVMTCWSNPHTENTTYIPGETFNSTLWGMFLKWLITICTLWKYPSLPEGAPSDLQAGQLHAEGCSSL